MFFSYVFETYVFLVASTKSYYMFKVELNYSQFYFSEIYTKSKRKSLHSGKFLSYCYSVSCVCENISYLYC